MQRRAFYPVKSTNQLQYVEEIIQECINGNATAQSKLYKMFANKMLGVCLRYCNSVDDAKDIMQEGFVKVFTTLHKFKGNSSVTTWITRIMMNTAIDNFRKNKKLQFTESFDKYQDTIDVEDTPEVVNEPLSVDELMALVQQLPTGYRVVFNMYAIDEMSHRDIANHLGISEGTSKSQLARARRQLQQWVNEKQTKQALNNK
jgi:RNA polymerase sigma factor (sigma-70 family)